MTTEKQIANHAQEMAALREQHEQVFNVPAGYLKCQLSTRGKLFAPAEFYIRNYTPSELNTLTLCPEVDLPIKKAEIYNGMIILPNGGTTDLNMWHVKEVEELDMFMLEKFYTDVLVDLPYEATDADLEYMKPVMIAQPHGEEMYTQYCKDVKEGKVKFNYNYDLKTMTYYEIPDNFKHTVSVVNKYDPNHTKITFDLPRYGDYMMLRKFTDKIFKKKDKQLQGVARQLQDQQEARKKFINGEQSGYQGMRAPENEDIEAFNDYTYDRTGFAINAALASYLVRYGDEDVSKLPLEEKMQRYIIGNPLITNGILEKMDEVMKEIKFGHCDTIKIKNPVTGQMTDYEFPFRDAVVLEAIRTAGPSEFDICLD